MNLLKQLRKRAKRAFEKIRNEKLKKNLLQAIPFWVASLLTGLVAVFYARLFGYAEYGILYILKHNAWLLFLITPCYLLLAWWLVVKFSPYHAAAVFRRLWQPLIWPRLKPLEGEAAPQNSSIK